MERKKLQANRWISETILCSKLESKKDLRLQRTKKKELHGFVFKKITELIEGADNNRNFINERLVFNESIGLYADDIPEDWEQINNVTVEMDMNEGGRLTRMVIDMGLESNEIKDYYL